MNTSNSPTDLSAKSAVVIGVGGLGCPALIALARAGVGRLVLVDDDVVELSNLHRQVLFGDDDLGRHKLDAAVDGLRRDGYTGIVELEKTRFVPESALALATRADILLEGADNFPTKFLACDAALLSEKPVVHGAAVRWTATAWCVGPGGGPCYRCLFEDVPTGDAVPNCAEAGVMAPVAGLAGALMADLALSYLGGTPQHALWAYDGKTDALRRVAVGGQPQCPLCGVTPSIIDIREARYLGGLCAA
jgi:adenylyltransferase/sulfurtransferase